MIRNVTLQLVIQQGVFDMHCSGVSYMRSYTRTEDTFMISLQMFCGALLGSVAIWYGIAKSKTDAGGFLLVVAGMAVGWLLIVFAP